MVNYKVVWTKDAEDNLKEIGNWLIAENIRERVENHLASHPFQNGRPMWGKLESLWRYRCLDKYRVIYEILEDKIIIKVLGIGDRWERFYEKFKERQK
ncbi:MAG: type II toxin-antitoxin system RelE/ParE family toxin [Spiroplasmataceae bacterium]|nr:type II toxin-antitoxin system RelE/ParE family toxin [Spiroplasmataceae bacterium]